MKRLFLISVWQLKLLAKYQVLSVALVIGFFYALAFKLLPVIRTEQITSLLVFSDPAMLGFIFVGAMILFEKGDNTLSAQVITPMQAGEYLAGKAFALLIPALICSFLIVIASQGLSFRFLPFILTTLFTSLIFTFLGIAGALKVNTFNQYIMVIPLFLLPVCLPLLNFFQVTHWKWLYVIPTQASLYLYQQSFSQVYPMGELCASAYLVVWVVITFYFARRSFLKKLYR
jgi:fluoroquinolone transport system permease protein